MARAAPLPLPSYPPHKPPHPTHHTYTHTLRIRALRCAGGNRLSRNENSATAQPENCGRGAVGQGA